MDPSPTSLVWYSTLYSNYMNQANDSMKNSGLYSQHLARSNFGRSEAYFSRFPRSHLLFSRSYSMSITVNICLSRSMWSLHHFSKLGFRRCASRGKGISYSYPHTWAIGLISFVVILSLPKNWQNKWNASQFCQSNPATPCFDSTMSLWFCLLCFSSDFCLLSRPSHLQDIDVLDQCTQKHSFCETRSQSSQRVWQSMRIFERAGNHLLLR